MTNATGDSRAEAHPEKARIGISLSHQLPMYWVWSSAAVGPTGSCGAATKALFILRRFADSKAIHRLVERLAEEALASHLA